MKKFYNITLLAIGAIITFISCGEDRSSEYFDLTKENQWIYTTMQEHYLWGDSMPSPKRNSYFSTTSKFFASLLDKQDNVSFFKDSIQNGSYGLDFVLMRDPLNIRPGKVYALVLNVMPGSPASEAGLERGAWISAVNNKALSTTSNAILGSGNGIEVVTEQICITDDTNEYYWETGDTLSITASTDFTIAPILLDSIYRYDEHTIGYIILNNMKGREFVQDIQNTMLSFAEANVTDVIVDLRYCNGGSIANAAALASTFVPPLAYDTQFSSLIGKDGIVDTVYNYHSQMTTLHDKRLYVIQGKETDGISRLFISSLKQTRKDSGLTTFGANNSSSGFNTLAIPSPYGFTINPVVSIMLDAVGNIIPMHETQADIPINELGNQLHINPLGYEDEYLLYNVLYYIIIGELP